MRSGLYLLGPLSDEDVEWITGNGIKETVAPGKSVIVEGEPLDAIFIILDGSFDVHLRNDQRSVADLHAGEFVGEISLLDSRPPSASVTAREQSIVLRIPRSRLNTKFQTDTAFAARMFRAIGTLLAQRLRQANQKLMQGAASEHDSADDIDPDVLEASAIAATRFQLILKKLSKS
ncbi:MAG: cyclic nucleotide-binding domain-containing protein [Planctomycetes bacterium]|nr:cyclic nucleotide-binding domain-containing protein [Planctomycetota bacterium]